MGYTVRVQPDRLQCYKRFENQTRVAFLRDQLLNVFLGAKDTATIGISDVFFHLARHPTVWRELRQEILRNEVPLDPGSFSSLRYLQAVFHESK